MAVSRNYVVAGRCAHDHGKKMVTTPTPHSSRMKVCVFSLLALVHLSALRLCCLAAPETMGVQHMMFAAWNCP